MPSAPSHPPRVAPGRALRGAPRGAPPGLPFPAGRRPETRPPAEQAAGRAQLERELAQQVTSACLEILAGLARMLPAVEALEQALGEGELGPALAPGCRNAGAPQLESAVPTQLPGPAAQRLAALTPREQEVAALVARGLTNRQIAEMLVICERTVDSHLAHMLAKLGLSTRTQVAAWVLESRPALPRPGWPPARASRRR